MPGTRAVRSSRWWRSTSCCCSFFSTCPARSTPSTRSRPCACSISATRRRRLRRRLRRSRRQAQEAAGRLGAGQYQEPGEPDRRADSAGATPPVPVAAAKTPAEGTAVRPRAPPPWRARAPAPAASGNGTGTGTGNGSGSGDGGCSRRRSSSLRCCGAATSLATCSTSGLAARRYSFAFGSTRKAMSANASSTAEPELPRSISKSAAWCTSGCTSGLRSIVRGRRLRAGSDMGRRRHADSMKEPT